MSANHWSVVESILIGVFFIVLLYGLICSSWMTFRAGRHIWLWRLYALLIWGSLALIVGAVMNAAPEPELPKSLALGLWLLLAGLGACIAHHLLHLWRRRQTPVSGMSAQ